MRGVSPEEQVFWWSSSDRPRQSLRRQVAAAPAREPSRTARCVAGSRAPEKNGIVQRTRRSFEQRTRARTSVGGVQLRNRGGQKRSATAFFASERVQKRAKI